MRSSRNSSSLTSTTRRPSTAPLPQTSHLHHLDIASIPSSGYPTPLSYGKSTRIRFVDLPAFEIKDRSGVEQGSDRLSRIADHSGSVNSGIYDEDQQSLSSPGLPQTIFGIKASSPSRTQEEWKIIHGRQQGSPSFSKGQHDEFLQLKGRHLDVNPGKAPMGNTIKRSSSRRSANANHIPPQVRNSPQSGSSEALFQEGVSVPIHQGRLTTTHLVPVLPYHHPAPPQTGGLQAMSPTSTQDPEGHGHTPSSASNASGEGRRQSIVGMVTRVTRGILPGAEPSPPRPRRSSSRPATADAIMSSHSSSSISTPSDMAPRPSSSDMVPTPIPEASVENSPALSAPPVPVIRPVNDEASDANAAMSPIDPRQFQTTSPRGSSPLSTNRATSPPFVRWVHATAPPLDNFSDTSHNSPEFIYHGEVRHLTRVISSDTEPHSRESRSTMLQQVASNLRVEALGDEDSPTGVTHSPDLSIWNSSAARGTSNSGPMEPEDSSSFCNTPGSFTPARALGSVPTTPRSSPFFGGDSLSRRRGSSRASEERETSRSNAGHPEQRATIAELAAGPSRIDRTTFPWSASAGHIPAGTTDHRRTFEASAEETHDNVVTQSDVEDGLYVPVTRASFGSSAQSQQERAPHGSFSSAGMASPSTWSNALPSMRRPSTQHGSDTYEQILTPGSIYSPLAAKHEDESTQVVSMGPRSPEIAPRDLGSQTSGQSTQGDDDIYVLETPRGKEGLSASTTMGSTSSTSHYSSCPSEAPLLPLAESSSERVTEEQDLGHQTFSTRDKLLLVAQRAAQRQNKGLPDDRKFRRPLPMVPKTHLNYNPEGEEQDPPPTPADPTPQFSEPPLASGSGSRNEAPAGPRTIHQTLDQEQVRPAAGIPEFSSQVTDQQPQRFVGLGIILPVGSPGASSEAGPSGTSEPYDPVKDPIDRLKAGKVKEKREDAGEYLRRQKEVLFQRQAEVVARTARRMRGFRSRPRSIVVIATDSPILEAQVESDSPQQRQTEIRQASSSVRPGLPTTPSAGEHSIHANITIKDLLTAKSDFPLTYCFSRIVLSCAKA